MACTVKFIFFIILTILQLSGVVSAPEVIADASALAPAPPPKPFYVYFFCSWAFIIKPIIIMLLHRPQNIPEEQIFEQFGANEDPRNPYQPVQEFQLNARERRNIILQKLLNLVVTIALFFIAMFLQYDFKNPEASVFGVLTFYIILALAILSFFVKNFYDYGHLDFTLTMLYQVVQEALSRKEEDGQIKILATFITCLMLLLLAFDNRLTHIRDCYLGIRNFIRNCICGGDDEHDD